MRSDAFGPVPPRKFGPSRTDQDRAFAVLNSLQASGGAGLRVIGGGGIQGLPPDPDEVWAVIRAAGSGGGADQGSGQGNQGALHAWRQIRFFAGINGTWEEDPSGIWGTTDVNPLVELNGFAIPAGTVVRAYRGPANLCWVCTWSGSDGSGGGQGSWEITCTSTGASARRV